MKSISDIPLSLLDLVNYPEGKTIPEAFRRSKDLAQKAEELGYHRFWMAEHHNLTGIASSATSILIGHIAGHTKKIRVGSGGIMLPNHAPLVIAEQFGTLEHLYPGRIDLGLGRAAGTDPFTTKALRHGSSIRGDDFPELIEELEYFFAPAEPGQKLKAIPGEGVNIPIWILGSSHFSAHLAARLGRPYAFAGHFAPAQMLEAFDIYRREFQPSRHLQKPHTMVGVAVIASDTNEKADYLSTSALQRFLSLIRGNLKQTPPPVESMEGLWSPQEEAHVRGMTHTMIVGGPEKIKSGLQSLVNQTGADEIIMTSDLYDDEERLKSIEIVMKAVK